MLIMTRETLLLHVSEITGLVDLMQSQNGEFIPKTLAWFRKTEKSLQRLRSPLSSVLATERAKIIACAEGLPAVSSVGEKLSKRKLERSTTVAALDRVQQHLLDAAQQVDAKFDPYFEKMAQFLAVSTGIRPIQLPMTAPKSEWLKHTWRNLAVPDELRNMYAYLNSALTIHDRMYVLETTLNNLFDGLSTASTVTPAAPNGDMLNFEEVATQNSDAQTTERTSDDGSGNEQVNPSSQQGDVNQGDLSSESRGDGSYVQNVSYGGFSS